MPFVPEFLEDFLTYQRMSFLGFILSLITIAISVTAIVALFLTGYRSVLMLTLFIIVLASGVGSAVFYLKNRRSLDGPACSVKFKE